MFNTIIYLFLFGFFVYLSPDTIVSDDGKKIFFQPMEMILLFNDGRISLAIKKSFSKNHFLIWNDVEKISKNPNKNFSPGLDN
jgi:hypothetical protein